MSKRERSQGRAWRCRAQAYISDTFYWNLDFSVILDDDRKTWNLLNTTLISDNKYYFELRENPDYDPLFRHT